MITKLKEIETQALEFPVNDRATLAEHLLASLDINEEAELEQCWLEEADFRFQEYKKGNISSRPAKDVLTDARNLL